MGRWGGREVCSLLLTPQSPKTMRQPPPPHFQARVERMEQFQKEKEELDKGCRECKRKLAECQRKLKELEVAEPGGGSGGARGERERLQAEAQQLRHEERNWESKMEELRKKEKNMPWNVDTLSKDGFSKVGRGLYPLPPPPTSPPHALGLLSPIGVTLGLPPLGVLPPRGHAGSSSLGWVSPPLGLTPPHPMGAPLGSHCAPPTPPPERLQREGRGEGGDGGAEGAEAQNLRGAPREADQALW